LDNVMARAAARAAGADEALMLNTQGHVAGGAAANIFWTLGERLVTPALEVGVLDGVMRARVLAAAARAGVETLEARVSAAGLEAAEAMFLTNSLIGLREVSSLDGRSLAQSAMAARLRAAL
jgi:branched-chain amino acid aminotransferase/4-amino-4-deoxychorismate lyase